MDNEIDRKIDVTAMQFLLVQNRHQTHNWTLIGSGANGIGIQKNYRIKRMCVSGPDTPIVIVGNKLDLVRELPKVKSKSNLYNIYIGERLECNQ